MTKYIIRRLLGMIPTLLVIITISFFIIRIAPGGPFDSEKALPEQVLKNIEAKYHLDEPLIMQYGRYLFDIAGETLDRRTDTRITMSISISSPAFQTPSCSG